MTRPRRLALALVSLWLGVMIMLSAVAPAVFGVVGQKEAGTILRRIFPYYYAMSLAVPLLAFVFSFPQARRSRAGVASLLTLGLSFGLAAWNFLVLSPRIAAARLAMAEGGGAGGASAAAIFGRLHVQSVGVLLSLMVLALLYIGIEVLAGPGPVPPRR